MAVPTVDLMCTFRACGQKTTRCTGRSSRASAPHRKTSPPAQGTGGHRRVVTRTRRRATWLPEEEQATQKHEWSGTTVSRYGHLRSAPVVVDASLRTEWELPTLRAFLSVSTRPTWAPPRWHPASPATRKCVCVATGYVKVQKFARDEEEVCGCKVLDGSASVLGKPAWPFTSLVASHHQCFGRCGHTGRFRPVRCVG